MKILENKSVKVLQSENYNFFFNKVTGFFARWGKTQEEDPEYSPYGPEIVDCEISTICSGVSGIGPCKFCYKSNTSRGSYMSLETFKKLFAKLPRTVGQVAFGIGDIDANPDMWKIFEYCRENGVIPNVTINGEGVTDEIADKLVSLCGAVAVSLYDKEKSYNTIKKLTDRGLTQCNIHYMLSRETVDGAWTLLNDRLSDERLSKLNAIVFLSLKPKGRAVARYNSLSQEDFTKLVDFALDHKIGIGFDSCGAQKFTKAIENKEDFEKWMQMVEPCESGLFSMYVNVEGKFFPCSFAEGYEGWKDGIDLLNSGMFWWMNPRIIEWRNALLANKRSCPMYEI